MDFVTSNDCSTLIDMVHNDSKMKLNLPNIDNIHIKNLELIELNNESRLEDVYYNCLILEKVIVYCETIKLQNKFNIELLKFLSKIHNTLDTILIECKKLLKKSKSYINMLDYYLKLSFFIYSKSDKILNNNKLNYYYFQSIFSKDTLKTLSCIEDKNMPIIFYDMNTVMLILQCFSIEMKKIKYNEKYIDFLNILIICIGYNCCFINSIQNDYDKIKITIAVIMHFKTLIKINHYFYHNIEPLIKNNNDNNNDNNISQTAIIENMYSICNFDLNTIKKYIIDFCKKYIDEKRDLSSLEKFEFIIKEEMLHYYEYLVSKKKMKLDPITVKFDDNTIVTKQMIIQKIIKYCQRTSEFNEISTIFKNDKRKKIYQIFKYVPSIDENIMGYLYLIIISKYLSEYKIDLMNEFFYLKTDIMQMFIDYNINIKIFKKSNNYPIIIQCINSFMVIYREKYVEYDDILSAFLHLLLLIYKYKKEIVKFKSEELLNKILKFLIK